MQPTLFPATPHQVTPRYRDPGDRTPVPKHRRRPPSHNAKPPTHSERATARRNAGLHLSAFRQPIADADELEFRHMHWQRIRDQVVKTLRTVATPTRVLDRICNCGAECVIEWSETAQRYRLRASYCHSKHCKPCAKSRSNLVSQNLQAKLTATSPAAADRFRFVTLTLRHSREPLREQIQSLFKHFRKLRSTPLWRTTQRGGYFSVEIPLNDRREWHPHLHIITEGDYLPQAALATLWEKITHGSFKVDVRKINSIKDVAIYVAKYVSKGVPDSVWSDPDRAQEWILASKGLRSCATFGTWRGFRLLKPNPAVMVNDWKPIALLSRKIDEARNGSLSAIDLLFHLQETIQFNPNRPRRQPANST